MSKLTEGFKKPPNVPQTDKGKGIIKEDAQKKRKQLDLPKESKESKFMGASCKSARVKAAAK